MKSNQLVIAFLLLAVAGLAYIVYTHHRELIILSENGNGPITFDPMAPPAPVAESNADDAAGMLPPDGAYGGEPE